MKDIYNSQEGRNIAVWLLEHTKSLIEERREEFVCIGLMDVADRHGSEFARAVAYQLREYVESAMALGASTYEIWLNKKFPPGEFPSDTYRAGRLAWIADMIAALEKGETLPARPSLPPGFEWPKPLDVDLRRI